MMKPRAVVINASRGPAVDANALYEAVAGDQLRGAPRRQASAPPLPDDPLGTLEQAAPNHQISNSPRSDCGNVRTRGAAPIW